LIVKYRSICSCPYKMCVFCFRITSRLKYLRTTTPMVIGHRLVIRVTRVSGGLKLGL